MMEIARSRKEMRKKEEKNAKEEVKIASEMFVV